MGDVGIGWDAGIGGFFSPGVEQLRDGSTESFWQSDGPQLLGTRKIDELLWMVMVSNIFYFHSYLSIVFF